MPGRGAGVAAGERQPAETEVGRRRGAGEGESGLERLAGGLRLAELEPHLAETDQGGRIARPQLQGAAEALLSSREIARHLEHGAQGVGPAGIGGSEPRGVLETGPGRHVELVERVQPAAPAKGLGQLRGAGGKPLDRPLQGPPGKRVSTIVRS